ncbi:MAG TPA: biliverdin-producing heme oxygenase [Rhizomicrobium sp.]|jgi:heme oxygenase|nr:biliverdin-producing heme oxygenase [Rhizomicrobium sp.]
MLSSDVLSVRQFLRSATAVIHQRLDDSAALMRLDTPGGYARFLAAHAAALLPMERELEEVGIGDVLPDWPQRARAGALRADLAELGAGFVPLDPPLFGDDAAAMGAAYVLEGSRLGASVLRQRVPDGLPMRYLRHGEGGRLWPTFLKRLEEADCVRRRPHVAKAGAVAAFSLFEIAMQQVALGAGTALA